MRVFDQHWHNLLYIEPWDTRGQLAYAYSVSCIEQEAPTSVSGGSMSQGLECALLAPTAINQQKFYFELDGDEVKLKKGKGFYTGLDLGIVRYHFEIGAKRRI